MKLTKTSKSLDQEGCLSSEQKRQNRGILVIKYTSTVTHDRPSSSFHGSREWRSLRA